MRVCKLLAAAAQGVTLLEVALNLVKFSQDDVERGAELRQLDLHVETPARPRRPWMFVKTDEDGLVTSPHVSLQRATDLALAESVARQLRVDLGKARQLLDEPGDGSVLQ